MIVFEDCQHDAPPVVFTSIFTPAFRGPGEKKKESNSSLGATSANLYPPGIPRWLSVNAITTVTTYGGIE